MKTMLTAAALALVSTTALADSSRLGFDGCYDMYRPGSMFPSFCLLGTAEEGVGGSNVRLALFHTNTDQVTHCLRSDAVELTEDSFTFIVNNKKEMILKNVVEENGLKSGVVVLGKTVLNFLERDETTTDQLMRNAVEFCSK
jgi:hypothetical protein